MLVTSQDSAALETRASEWVENTPQQTKITVMTAVSPKTTKSVRSDCSAAKASGDRGMPFRARSGCAASLVIIRRLLVTHGEVGSTVTLGRDLGNSKARQARGTGLGAVVTACSWWRGSR